MILGVPPILENLPVISPILGFCSCLDSWSSSPVLKDSKGNADSKDARGVESRFSAGDIRRFPQMGVTPNGWSENPIKMDDLGLPLDIEL